MMILGEICNFTAYAFVDAIVVVRPSDVVSHRADVVLDPTRCSVCCHLCYLILHLPQRDPYLFRLDWLLPMFVTFSSFLPPLTSLPAIVGSVIIALNGPQEQAVSTISEFQKLFFSVGFLVFGSIIIIISLVIIFFFAPKYGKDNMIWYIAVCSMIGGLSVSCIQGLGAAIVTTAKGNNQVRISRFRTSQAHLSYPSSSNGSRISCWSS